MYGGRVYILCHWPHRFYHRNENKFLYLLQIRVSWASVHISLQYSGRTILRVNKYVFLVPTLQIFSHISFLTMHSFSQNVLQYVFQNVGAFECFPKWISPVWMIKWMNEINYILGLNVKPVVWLSDFHCVYSFVYTWWYALLFCHFLLHFVHQSIISSFLELYLLLFSKFGNVLYNIWEIPFHSHQQTVESALLDGLVQSKLLETPKLCIMESRSQHHSLWDICRNMYMDSEWGTGKNGRL